MMHISIVLTLDDFIHDYVEIYCLNAHNPLFEDMIEQYINLFYVHIEDDVRKWLCVINQNMKFGRFARVQQYR